MAKTMEQEIRQQKMNWKENTPGWILLYEEAFLNSLCMSLPPNPKCINIGSGAGTSTCAMLRAGAYVISIDIDIEMHSLEREAVVKQTLPESNLYQELKSSAEAAKGFVKESADLIFVDGVHSFEGVKSDLGLYTPKLKPGGILVCHDYTDPRQKEVTRAIRQWHKANPDWLQIGQVLYMVAFKKPGGDEAWKNGRIA
jgi:predicted O-methyltransferase YrrM